MKRYKANGELIKKLRQNRDRAATQKEFAHEVRISERQLREAENRDAAMARDILERIAKSLGKSWQAIIVGGAEHTPADASLSTLPVAQQALAKEPLVIVPRFDSTSASMTRDEVELVSQAKDNRVVVSHLGLPSLGRPGAPEVETLKCSLLDGSSRRSDLPSLTPPQEQPAQLPCVLQGHGLRADQRLPFPLTTAGSFERL